MDENALITRGYRKGSKYNKYERIGHKKNAYYKLHSELRSRRSGNHNNTTSAPVDAQKTEETGVSDVFITTNKLALSIKYLSDNWILDSGVTSYICYDLNLFDSLAPTSARIIWGGVITLLIYSIKSITVSLPNLARVVLESVLYILELQLNLVSFSRLI